MPSWLTDGLRDSLGRDHPVVAPWVACGLAGSVVVTAIVTGTFAHALPDRVGNAGGFGWPAMTAGRWWTVVTSFLLTRNWFMAITMPPALLLALGTYERRAGHLRTVAVAGFGHVTGSVLVGLACGFLGWSNLAVFVRAARNLDYGGSMAVAAGLGALAGRIGDRRVVRLALVGAVVGVVAHHQMADWGHLVALPTGMLVDRVRRPVVAWPACAAGLAATIALTWVGPSGVQSAVQEVRFTGAVRFTDARVSPPSTTTVPGPRPSAPAAPAPGRATAGDRGRTRVLTVTYLASHLGGRPETARVLAPVGPARARLPVIVALHGIPGTADDWFDGGAIDRELDARIARHALPPAVVVLPNPDLFHAPSAGWADVPGQRQLTSVMLDLLPEVAAERLVAVAPRSVAVIGVGRGADGALALGRADPAVGWVVVIDPRGAVPAGPRDGPGGPWLLVLRSAPEPHARNEVRAADEQWARWRVQLGPALDWLAADGFGTSTVSTPTHPAHGSRVVTARRTRRDRLVPRRP